MKDIADEYRTWSHSIDLEDSYITVSAMWWSTDDDDATTTSGDDSGVGEAGADLP